MERDIAVELLKCIIIIIIIVLINELINVCIAI